MSKSSHVGLAGLSAIAVAYGFGRYGYGLFLPSLRTEFGLSTEWLGLIASGSYAAYLVALVITGALAARVGPRPLVITGGLTAAAGTALVAAAPNAAVLAVGVLVAATSAGWTWAPFSDAVATLVPPQRRSRTLAVISTGTTFGLMVAGPVALLTGSAWRVAWVLFAGCAVVVAVWNAWLLPAGAQLDSQHRLPDLRWGWFVCSRSRPLFAVAFSYGLIAAFYYTYAVDLVRASGLPSSSGPLLWAVIGVGGTTGVITGDLAERFGVRRVLVACLALLSAAIALLAAVPASWPAVLASALVYGAAYMPIAALLVVWSASVFAQQPATGFSATVLVLAVGSIAGPAVLGAIAGQLGLPAAFFLAAGLTLCTALWRPTEDVRSTAAPAPRSDAAP
jgi:predicted MFS family arabinose efflux permease